MMDLYAVFRRYLLCPLKDKKLINSFVQIVFTDGLAQAFTENRTRASMVSSETGMVIIIERMDSIVTVIDAHCLLWH